MSQAQQLIGGSAYEELKLDADCDDDNTISTRFLSLAQEEQKGYSPKDDIHVKRRRLRTIRLAYGAIRTPTSRIIYAQIQDELSRLGNVIHNAKIVRVLDTISWSDVVTRAKIWANWAKTLPLTPLGFFDVRKVRYFHTDVSKGNVRFLSISYTLTGRVEASVTFSSGEADAPATETIRMEHSAPFMHNIPLNLNDPEIVGNIFPTINKACLQQIVTVLPELRCLVGRRNDVVPDVPSHIEVGDSVSLTQFQIRKALTQDECLELANAASEAAADLLARAAEDAQEQIRSKHPDAHSIAVSITDTDFTVGDTYSHPITHDADTLCILEIPCIVQGYVWDQTPRYICVNLVTGDCVGLAGTSKLKLTGGALSKWFKSLIETPVKKPHGGATGTPKKFPEHRRASGAPAKPQSVLSPQKDAKPGPTASKDDVARVMSERQLEPLNRESEPTAPPPPEPEPEPGLEGAQAGTLVATEASEGPAGTPEEADTGLKQEKSANEARKEPLEDHDGGERPIAQPSESNDEEEGSADADAQKAAVMDRLERRRAQQEGVNASEE